MQLRLSFLFAVLSVSGTAWIYWEHELTDLIFQATLLSVCAIAFIKSFSPECENKRISAWLSSLTFAAFGLSLIAKSSLHREVDKFVREFVTTNACISTDALILDGWENKRGTIMVKKFYFLGFSRQIILQNNGYLRYGGLSGISKSHNFKICSPSS